MEKEREDTLYQKESLRPYGEEGERRYLLPKGVGPAVTNGECSFVGLWSLNNLMSATDLLPHANSEKRGALLECELAVHLQYYSDFLRGPKADGIKPALPRLPLEPPGSRVRGAGLMARPAEDRAPRCPDGAAACLPAKDGTSRKFPADHV
ncbi:uncharacterized protein LOC144306685 [Canis aureus]